MSNPSVIGGVMIGIGNGVGKPRLSLGIGGTFLSRRNQDSSPETDYGNEGDSVAIVRFYWYNYVTIKPSEV